MSANNWFTKLFINEAKPALDRHSGSSQDVSYFDGSYAMEFHADSEAIGDDTFSGCSGLAAITFKGTPTSISSVAFQDCPRLATINVPWSEGAVANAPWGATNATINYNYTGE